MATMHQKAKTCSAYILSLSHYDQIPSSYSVLLPFGLYRFQYFHIQDTAIRNKPVPGRIHTGDRICDFVGNRISFDSSGSSRRNCSHTRSIRLIQWFLLDSRFPRLFEPGLAGLVMFILPPAPWKNQGLPPIIREHPATCRLGGCQREIPAVSMERIRPWQRRFRWILRWSYGIMNAPIGTALPQGCVLWNMCWQAPTLQQTHIFQKSQDNTHQHIPHNHHEVTQLWIQLF